ncbi:lipopolysaccharide heptosyltransferase II [Sulfurospirillum arsenophilum]|uniref:lipopolysaccharide heptosyltransferase II n=1 Tax=Sulfurospirillum arsenophilum TaxID=56698 RepID=UPI0005AAC6A4|nr:lipopolysaccharide heptosyltransferase II [Sulfurospirillum arsenophilum]
MRIFIELPTWLGDAIMATPAIENILEHYPNADITLFGSFVSTEALKMHPRVSRSIVDESKKAFLRFYWLYQHAQQLGSFDIAISFRSSLTSSFLLWSVSAKKKFCYTKNVFKGHQVEKYTQFIAKSLHVKTQPLPLKLYQTPFHFDKPTLGINPGATYGSAKRWYPEEFAKVAAYFANRYDIVIFGGPNEVDIAKEVEEKLKENAITNVTNLAGKTTIQELIQNIAGLSLFVTNDSGPMHVAAAYQIPTVALFGPTKYNETAPWQNANSTILSHDLVCAPCMKRECPIKTHECMRGIKAEEVISLLERHLSLDK